MSPSLFRRGAVQRFCPKAEVKEAQGLLETETAPEDVLGQWLARDGVNLAAVDRKGKEATSQTPGMVVTIPAEVKHWHGAKKDSWFSHIAVEVPGEATSNEWCEPVDDAAYNGLE